MHAWIYSTCLSELVGPCVDVQVLSKTRTQQDKDTLEMTEMEVSGRYDDAMDAFGMHGVGGIVGGILTGFFANDFVSGHEDERGVFYGRGVQLGIQIYAIVVVAGWSFLISCIILIILSKTMGVRVSGTCKPFFV
jgi:ammonia channel protein AmtB